jgi:hypothetical protein
MKLEKRHTGVRGGASLFPASKIRRSNDSIESFDLANRRSTLTHALSICFIMLAVAATTASGQVADDESVDNNWTNCGADEGDLTFAPDESLAIDSPLNDFSRFAATKSSDLKRSIEACPGQPGFDPNRIDPTIGEDKSRIGYIEPEAPRVSCANPVELNVDGGIRDNFALPQDPVNLTNEIRLMGGNVQPWKWAAFDNDATNMFFGHATNLSFNGAYRYGTLFLDMVTLPEQPENDMIYIWSSGSSGGWSARIRDLMSTNGKPVRLALNLAQMRSGNRTMLDDVNAFKNLNIFMQDDTTIDNMRIALRCNAEPAVPLVGVISNVKGCGSQGASSVAVFLDNQDKNNSNERYGWLGATISTKNTEFRLCAVDGRQFTQAAAAGANFALVALSGTCPDGFTRFDRFHDNEDDNPSSADTAPPGSPTATVGPKLDTNMAFCVANGSNPRASNGVFPDLGFSYGVFGGRTRSRAPWALQFGEVKLDDENKNNRNQPKVMPAWTFEFVIGDLNTRYFMAQVK